MARIRLLLLAVVGGLLLGLSQPLVSAMWGGVPLDPSGLTGLLCFVGFVPALVAMRGHGPKRGYGMGFVTCFVQFTIIVYWVVVAMTVFGGIPLVPSLLVLSLMTSAMACYVASAFAVTRVLVGRFGVPQWLAFAACLTAAELLRNYGPLGGFPWGNVGYSLATVPVLRQGASLFGVYGLVFVIGLVNGGVAEVASALVDKRAIPRRPVVVTAAVLAGLLAWGGLRLATIPVGGPTVKVGLLQGNIEQGIKNKSEQNGRLILDKFHALQADALARGAELVVWPEAWYPFRALRDKTSLKSMGVVPDDGPFAGMIPPAMIVGVSGSGRELDPATGKKRDVHSNSAFITGPDLAVKARVDKTHLVPFGEYVPWPLASVIRQLVPIAGSDPGTTWDPTTLRLGARDVRVGTTICYEGIFPEITRAFTRNDAELMVNITNDAWYGVSSAATQHLLMYSLRAVESARPVARAANTGVSAWIDVRGAVHDATGIFTDQALVVEVPLSSETTLYTVVGEWVALPCLVAVLGAWIVAILGPGVVRRPRRRTEAVLGWGGLAVAVLGALLYFVVPNVLGDEARATHALLAVLGGLLVGVGALSGRPWGRKAQLWVGGLLALFAGLAVGMGATWAALLVVTGAAVMIIARRSPAMYTRALDPLVHLEPSRDS